MHETLLGKSIWDINQKVYKMEHGIDCPCKECEKIRKLLCDGVESGMIHLVGLEADKKKILS